MDHRSIVNLKMEYEKDGIKEIYRYPEGNHSLVINEKTGRVMLKKVLPIYNLQVYEYLSSHRNLHIPQIYLYEVDAGKNLIVFEEFIQGRTLTELIAEGSLTTEEKCRIVKEITEGVKYLHEATPQIIHRDIKSDNVIICDDGRVVVIDYDAAKVYDPSRDRDTVLIGTVGSAAPEQYGFAQSDQRTDIYALGVLIRQLFPEDRRWQRIADKATRIDPDQRYQTVDRMRAAMGMLNKRTIPVPGFRTLTPWKMVTASAGFAFIFYWTLSMEVKNAVSVAEVWFNRLVLLSALLMIVDLCTEWTPLFRNIPLKKVQPPVLKVLCYAVCSFLIIVLWASLAIAVTSLFFRR